MRSQKNNIQSILLLLTAVALLPFLLLTSTAAGEQTPLSVNKDNPKLTLSAAASNIEKTQGFRLNIILERLSSDSSKAKKNSQSVDYSVVVVNPDFYFVECLTEGIKSSFIQKGDKMVFLHPSMDEWIEPNEQDKKDNEVIKRLKERLIVIANDIDSIKILKEDTSQVEFAVVPNSAFIKDILPHDAGIDMNSVKAELSITVDKTQALPVSIKGSAEYDLLIEKIKLDEKKDPFSIWDGEWDKESDLLAPDEDNSESPSAKPKEDSFVRQKERIEIKVKLYDYNGKLNVSIPAQAKNLLGMK